MQDELSSVNGQALIMRWLPSYMLKLIFANSFANKILENKSPMFWGVLKKFGFLRKTQNPHSYGGYFVQRLHSVNLLASPSVVRIHHPPPDPQSLWLRIFFYIPVVFSLGGTIASLLIKSPCGL